MIEYILNLFQNNWFCFIAGIIVACNLLLIARDNKWIKAYRFKKDQVELMYKFDIMFLAAQFMAKWLVNAEKLLAEKEGTEVESHTSDMWFQHAVKEAQAVKDSITKDNNNNGGGPVAF